MDHVCKKCLGAGWVRNPDTTPPTAQPAPVQELNQSPHPEYDRGFSNGWDRCFAAAQRQSVRSTWVGLTDEEIMEMLDYGQYGRVPQYARNFVDAIEAKLKEMNT